MDEESQLGITKNTDEFTHQEQGEEIQPKEEATSDDPEAETADSADLSEGDKKLCEICQDYFWDDNSLKEHLDRHETGLICSLCGYESTSQSQMIAHSRAHMNKESIQCLMCKERLHDEGKFELHIAAHSKKLASCPWCPYVNKGATDLKKHLDLHLKGFRMNCNFCKYYGFSAAELKAHSTIHETTSSRSRLRTRSFPGRHFEGGSFRKRREYDMGSKEEEGTTGRSDLTALLSRALFRCSLCGARPANHAAFEAHQTEHVKPGLAYCPHCDYRTDDRDLIIYHVLQHIRVHESIKLNKQSK